MLSTCTPLPALFGEPPLAPMVLISAGVARGHGVGGVLRRDVKLHLRG